MKLTQSATTVTVMASPVNILLKQDKAMIYTRLNQREALVSTIIISKIHKMFASRILQTLSSVRPASTTA